MFKSGQQQLALDCGGKAGTVGIAHLESAGLYSRIPAPLTENHSVDSCF
jgi:hypothetical protein